MEVTLLVSLGLILIKCLAVFGFDDEEYCYSEDETPYGYFGTKTPYDNVRSKEIKSPTEDGRITYMWALISHGTRYVTDSDGLSSRSLCDIRDEIVKNHEEYGRGELCEEDLNLLKNWKFPWDEKTYGELAKQGKVDMENLAVRWGKKFPGFIYQQDKFRFHCSSAQLPRNSATAFRDKIYGSEPRVEFNDELFKTRPFINASENKELDEFTKSSFMEDILFDINTRLGYENRNLSFDAVTKLYRQCALEKANKPSAKSAFCSIFISDHLEAMEYCDDLDTYYALGYGDSNNVNRGCSLARDIFQKLDKIRLDNTPPHQQGVFNFGHGYNVLTLLMKLGLFADSKPLKHDNYESQDSREWRTSLIDPFSSNIFIVMFNSSQQLKISFYVNEGLIQYPGCDKGVCLWSSLRKKFKDEILNDCPRGKSSAIRLPSVNVQSIVYSLVFIFYLNSWGKLIHIQ